MSDGEHIVDGPVDDQAGGKAQEQGGEHDGHEHHELSLPRIPRCGRHLLLQDHRGTHEDGGYVHGVLGREVGDPKEEGGVPQLNGSQESTIQGKENGDLHKDGKAPARRVYLVLLVKFHDLLVKFVLVLLVPVPQSVYLGLEF